MSEKTAAILGILKTADTFISGETICQQLSISRSAVSKHIQQLRLDGYQIKAINNRGYLLVEITDRPIPSEVTAHLETQFLGRQYDYKEETGSTNADLMELATKEAKEGTVICAGAQRAGHGRMKRAWHSPADQNLYFSVLLRPETEPWHLPQLALLSAAAIHRTLTHQHPQLNIQIKWPNDLFINGKKCSGILCEMKAELGSTHHVVIGIGLNCNTEAFPKELQDRATSLAIETGTKINRGALLAQILNTFEDYYRIWQFKQLTPFIPQLEEASLLKGRLVSLEQGNRTLTGTVLGINPDGTLKLKTTDQQILAIHSGEVHLTDY